MKKLAIGLAALLGVGFTSAAHADYAAIAASTAGSAYVQGFRSMEAARDAAVARCRNKWGGSCMSNIAEDSGWYFAAGVCGGVAYTAASPQGWDRAEQLVRAKGAADGRSRCMIFANE